LQQLHDRIADDQPRNARDFIDRMTRRVAELATFPQQGAPVPKYARDDVRQLFFGDYRIVYRIGAEQIDILTVRHTARLLPTRLQEL